MTAVLDQIATAAYRLLPENNRLERIWFLAKTDFRKRYYGSMLGLVWAFINPLSRLIIYYLVFTIVFKIGIPNYALFLFLGLVLWMFFNESTMKCIRLIQAKRYLLENIQINKLDIYYASILSTFMAFLFNFSVYFLASIVIGVDISWQIIFLPLLIFNLIVFIMGTQIILSLVHVFIRDIEHIWAIVSMLLFWFSGIVFLIDPEATWKTAVMAYMSPIFGVVDNAREILIYGGTIDWSMAAYDMVYAFAVLGIGLLLMRKYFGRALEVL